MSFCLLEANFAHIISKGIKMGFVKYKPQRESMVISQTISNARNRMKMIENDLKVRNLFIVREKLRQKCLV